jgi:hypothetical protein
MIVIEEDDSFIQKDGKAKMIIVAVKKADGKTVRFPYSAKLSLASLIKEVNEKVGSAPVSLERKDSLFVADTPFNLPINKELAKIAGMMEGKIQKEDLVKCVKLLPRIDKYAPIDMVVFNGDPSKGGIYRVLALPTGKVPYYEVIDDTDYHKGEIPRRVPAFPEEIEFFEKRKPPIPKEIGSFEEIFPCPVCQKKIACIKRDDEKYHGRCDDCQVDIVSDTIRQKALA